MNALFGSLPYCGAPPSPATLASRWNADPVLIVALVAGLAFALWRGDRPASGGRRWRERPWRLAALIAGWSVLALALTSPLCALSVALFSARIAQHLILMFVAAPLVVWAYAGPASADRPRAGGWAGSALAAGGFAAAIWFWHAPGPYAATFHGDLVYWTMHLTLLGAATGLWWSLIASPQRTPAAAVGIVAVTALQMGLLSALITFASHPFYTPHLLTTVRWGLTPLEDQQLGGALMWLPTGAILAGGLAVALVQVMQRPRAPVVSTSVL